MKKLLLGLILLSMGACATPVERTSASIIRLTSESGQGFCTGFMVAPNRILTASHCIENAVFADGTPTQLIQKDDYYDLAVLSTVSAKHPLRIRVAPTTYDEPLKGIGYGFGWDKPLVTVFRVMIPNHKITPEAVSGVIMQGQAIGGMSGGPLIDSQGQVVGINLRTYQGTTYSVGTTVIRAFLLDAGVE